MYMYYVLVDHLIQVMDTRMLKNEERYQDQWLLPTKHANINIIYDAYKPDLTKTRQEFGDEVRWWDVRWQLQDTKPSTLVANVDKTSEVAYPCVYNILHILLTMPVTCERSFSSMRRIKSYLRSTMTDERLSTLGVLHIHRIWTLTLIE